MTPVPTPRSIAGAAIVLLSAACARNESPPDARRDASPFAAYRPAAPAPSNLVPPSRKLLETCKQICNQSATLACANASGCIPNCLAFGSVTDCTAEIGAFYECLQKQPSPNWECGPDGAGSIRAGYCDEERVKASGCLKEKSGKRGGDAAQ
jgi:hypothetical protein